MDKKHEILLKHPKINSKDIAKIAGRLWRNESIEVKEYYHQKSRIAFQKHKLEYPNFVWITGKTCKREKEITLQNEHPKQPLVSLSNIVDDSIRNDCYPIYDHFDDLVSSFLGEFRQDVAP